jgi:phospholipid-binding lipoprotein MlaA
MTGAIIRRFAAAALAALALAGCATQQRSPSPLDPFEPANRAVFEFNDNADRFVFKPVAEGYRAVLPEFARTGVRNFFSNLRDPWIALNQLMQGKVELALSDSWRFIVNSTFGIAGLMDVATDMRLPKHNEDFGQTLGVWGVDTGPYLVLPIWGPSNVRDGVGLVADAYTYLPWWIPDWADWSHRVAWQNSLTAVDFVNIRANLLDTTDILEQAALDRYAFVRDAFFQRRRSLVYDGNPPAQPAGGGRSQAPPAAPGPAPAAAETAAPAAAAPATAETAAPAAAETAAPTQDAEESPVSAAPMDAPEPSAQVVEPRIPDNYDAVLAADAPRVVAATR